MIQSIDNDVALENPSTFNLQIDDGAPFAVGGNTSSRNLYRNIAITVNDNDGKCLSGLVTIGR